MHELQKTMIFNTSYDYQSPKISNAYSYQNQYFPLQQTFQNPYLISFVRTRWRGRGRLVFLGIFVIITCVLLLDWKADNVYLAIISTLSIQSIVDMYSYWHILDPWYIHLYLIVQLLGRNGLDLIWESNL